MQVTIKRIRSARHIRLRILPDGKIVLTCHPLTPQYLINKFLQEHEDWISKHTQKINQTREELLSAPKTLLIRGKQLQIRLQIVGKKPSVNVENDTILILAPSEDHNVVRAILEKWYKKQAKEHFEQRVPLLCDVADRDVMNVTIRSQRTRWGSCSSRNTISLNWRLIMAPDWVSDYVIYHEIAHLTHMNHSSKFWALVESYFPNYKAAEKWLSDNHQLLHF